MAFTPVSSVRGRGGRGRAELRSTAPRWGDLTRHLWGSPAVFPEETELPDLPALTPVVTSPQSAASAVFQPSGDQSSSLVPQQPRPSFVQSPGDLRVEFAGGAEELAGFLGQIGAYLAIYGDCFASEAHKVQFILSKLRGEAQEWLLDLQRSDAGELSSVQALTKGLWERFGDPYWRQSAAERLRTLVQGTKGVLQYASEFRRYAGRLPDWSEEMKVTHFRNGLNPSIWAATVAMPSPTTLSGWIQQARAAEENLRAMETAMHHQRVLAAVAPAGVFPAVTAFPVAAAAAGGSATAMTAAVGGAAAVMTARSAPPQRPARRRRGSCFGCGATDHFVAACPARRPVAVSGVPVAPVPPAAQLVPVRPAVPVSSPRQFTPGSRLSAFGAESAAEQPAGNDGAWF